MPEPIDTPTERGAKPWWALLGILALTVVAIPAINALRSDDTPAGPPATKSTATTTAAPNTAAPSGRTQETTGPRAGAATPSTTAAASTLTSSPPDGKTAAQRTMVRAAKITEGGLRPKSVVYSGGDYFFAQNMMYAHTITVYDRSFKLVKTISDTVDLAALGQTEHTGTFQGSPVEAAFTHDGAFMYASNYQMYGPGFDNPGSDTCPGTGNDPSFVYRINVATLTIDQAIKVGAVPKYVAVTPDDSKVLVTNWCTYDMSIIDPTTAKETGRIKLGRFPRGIAVTPDSKLAFVAVMGSTDIAIVNLETQGIEWIRAVGDAPRHLVLSPDGTTLYATLNGDGKVAKIDVRSRTVTARVSTGAAPRSMAISDDGTALYVVNYNEDSVSKLNSADMTELSKLPTDHHPIGITYDPNGRTVWVACYVGSLLVFRES